MPVKTSLFDTVLLAVSRRPFKQLLRVHGTHSDLIEIIICRNERCRRFFCLPDLPSVLACVFAASIIRPRTRHENICNGQSIYVRLAKI